MHLTALRIVFANSLCNLALLFMVFIYILMIASRTALGKRELSSLAGMSVIQTMWLFQFGEITSEHSSNITEAHILYGASCLSRLSDCDRINAPAGNTHIVLVIVSHGKSDKKKNSRMRSGLHVRNLLMLQNFFVIKHKMLSSPERKKII